MADPKNINDLTGQQPKPGHSGGENRNRGGRDNSGSSRPRGDHAASPQANSPKQPKGVDVGGIGAPLGPNAPAESKPAPPASRPGQSSPAAGQPSQPNSPAAPAGRNPEAVGKPLPESATAAPRANSPAPTDGSNQAPAKNAAGGAAAGAGGAAPSGGSTGQLKPARSGQSKKPGKGSADANKKAAEAAEKSPESTAQNAVAAKAAARNEARHARAQAAQHQVAKQRKARLAGTVGRGWIFGSWLFIGVVIASLAVMAIVVVSAAGANKDGSFGSSSGGSNGGGTATADCSKLSGTPKDVIDTVALPIAHKIAFKEITPETVEAANAAHSDQTSSGNLSDHAGPPARAWAADISNGGTPTPEMDQLAKDLAKCFGIPWSGSGGPSATKNGYRIQLIYRTPASSVYGDHNDHVHIGVARGT